MKHYSGFLFVALFSLGQFSLWAEANQDIPRMELSVPQAERNLYNINADAGAASAVPDLRREMELRFDVYNRLFRFDPSLLKAPLNVRVFSDKEAYDQYVRERLGNTQAGAVYLHYNQTERRELVINRGSPEEASMLAYQAFVQYLRAFIANPPTWMREGFAIYFSTLRVSPEGKAIYEENLLWLESAKKLGDKLLSPESILTADISASPAGTPAGSSSLSSPELPAKVPEDFQISSWALVSFLLNSGWDYFRTLTESFMLLSPSAQAAENAQVVMKRFSLWNDFDAMDKDFRAYLDSRRTYQELLDDGQKAYSRGDTMNAELAFMTAMDQRPSDYAPYYYLGLLSYEDKDYDMAQQYYLSSIERGADEALVNYALGINAAAAGRGKDAIDFLHKAAALDPAKYQSRVDDLVKKLEE